MKQIISIVLILSMLLLFCSACSKQPEEDGVLAQIKGVGITKQQVENRILMNQIRAEAYANTALASVTDDLNAVTQEDALQELLECEAVRWQLLRAGTLIPRDQTDKNFDDEFAMLKTDQQQAPFYETLKKALEAHQVTEEEYVALSYDFAYDYYNMVYAKHVFFQSVGATEEGFNTYLEDLVKSLEVEYR